MKSVTCIAVAAALAATLPCLGADNARRGAGTWDRGATDVEWLGDNAVRITARPAATPLDAPAGELLLTDPDYSFSGLWESNAQGLTGVSATGLAVSVSPDGLVTVSNSRGGILADDGVRYTHDGHLGLVLRTDKPGASWYGGGERGYSRNLAGDTLVMYNKQNYGYTAGETRIKQMNITMPLVLSSEGFAVVFDDYAAARLIIGRDGRLTYETEGRGPVSYVVVSTPEGSLASLTRELTALTGRQDLAPLWSLGYITSKYGYKTQEETEQVIATLKEHGYPVDGIVLDLYWYGQEQDMGRLEWEPSQWPDHKGMLRSLKEQGVNTVTISQPYVLTNGRALANYNELKDKGVFVADSTGTGVQPVTIWVGEGGMFDVSSPAAREWLAKRYHDLTVEGVGGWWGDLGEPEVHPETGRHANGLTAREYHNKYGNDWSSIIYDLYRDSFPQTRLMTLMRGGTIGLQRYSVFPWSTDVSRSWGGLQPQVTIMLHSGLSGLGYMSHDVGGFAVDPENPRDAELYVRWLQLGLFSPVLRTHAQDVAEPYLYPEHEADIILPLIRERYSWLPYNYTLAWENATTGAPLVRPLNYYSAPGDTRFDNIADQFLWGRDVMVAPVLTPATESRSITFPEGRWLDIRNPFSSYEGGTTVADYPAPLDVLPVFVRAGAIIPRADYDMANTGDYRTNRYQINYYPAVGEKSACTIYEDDLVTPNAHAKGQSALIDIQADDTADAITLRATSTGSWNGRHAAKDLRLAVYGIQRPAAVTVDGRKAEGWTWDESTGRLNLRVDWRVADPLEVVITK